MTADLRQGVLPAVHAVLDRLEQEGGRMPTIITALLSDAEKAAAAARRADPQNGMAKRRVDRAREAAALLLRALEIMDREGVA